MEKFHLKEPKFVDERGSFIVTFYKSGNTSKTEPGLKEVNNLLLLTLFRRMLCPWWKAERLK